MESRRLFVGGLGGDINEKDLKDCFKSFGAVSAVDIIKRTDDTGCPIKTFAYIDVRQSEQDFKRCLSLLNNTKWKGGTLRIQTAKEHVLTRLARERRQEQEEANSSHKMNGNSVATREKSAVPLVLPKAVPGTPVSGMKNWVVGKFGRVLPVLYLRRRDSKKIAKFDPSKETHCLKKIKLPGPDVSVTEITWNLDTKMELACAEYKTYVTKEFQSNKSIRNQVNNKLSDRRAELDYSHRSVGQTFSEDSSCEEENSAEVLLMSEDLRKAISHCSNVHSRKTIDRKRLDAVLGQTGPTEDSLCIHNSGLKRSPYESGGEVTFLHETQDLLASKPDVKFKYNVLDSDNTCSSLSEAEFGHASFSEHEFLHCSGREGTKRKEKSPIEGYSGQCNRKPVFQNGGDHCPLDIQEAAPKQHISNQKRLLAVQEKLKQSKVQKTYIKDALQNLDRRKTDAKGKKHVKFSYSDDEAGTEKISGSKASSWLGLGCDSDEENTERDFRENETSNDLFALKPQFEGKVGEKLFKLQKSFGGDSRFNLDERFVESEEDLENESSDCRDIYNDKTALKTTLDVRLVKKHEATVGTHGDEISKDLAKEKAMSMNVLNSIFGRNYSVEFDRSDIEENPLSTLHTRNSTTVRYDPSRQDHKMYERIARDERVKKGEPETVQKQQAPEPLAPQVSQEKYYNVNTSSLTELFTANPQDKPMFTFLSPETDHDKKSSPSTEVIRVENSMETFKTNRRMTSKLPYDSSSDDDSDSDITLVTGLSSQTSLRNDLFFFHPDNPDLCNRLSDDAPPFMRTGSLEDVTEYWVSVRSELTQDYKRKHKDAIRRQNKLAAKRSKLK